MITITGIATRRTEEIIQNALVSRIESSSAEQDPASGSRELITPSIAGLEDFFVSRTVSSGGKDAASELANTIVCTAKVAVPSSVAACKPKRKIQCHTKEKVVVVRSAACSFNRDGSFMPLCSLSISDRRNKRNERTYFTLVKINTHTHTKRFASCLVLGELVSELA